MSYSIQNILVPVDLSETSLNALESAAALAKKHHANLKILNVSETILENKNGSHPLSKPANADVLNALTGAIHNIEAIQSSLLQKKGNVVETILSTALNEKIDLIVMGTHGASGFREGFIGSNTYGTIKNSSCPVLTIPAKRKVTSFNKILFPIRAISGALKHYNIVCHFLSPGSTLQVLGLSYLKMERDTGVLDKLVEEIQFQLDTEKVKSVVQWGNGNSISDDILQFASQSNSELIVLTYIIDAISKSNYIGPHTQRLINFSRIPVLSIKLNAVPAFV